MAQHDFVISNQGFPATRADINNFLQAVATTHSGTTTPTGAVAGTIWLDTTSATAPILKYYDGTDNITLATINHVANTVNFSDSASDLITDTTPQLGGNLDVNTHSIVSTSNGNITLTPNGTGDVVLSADTVKIGDLNANATITTDGTGDLILNTNSGTNSGSITIPDGANSNITIAPNGTGDILLDADTVRIGDSNANAVLTTNGTGDITVSTNSGTNSGTVKIFDGANGNIEITPNGTGVVKLDGISYPTADGSSGQVLQTNGSGVLSFASGGSEVKAWVHFNGTGVVAIRGSLNVSSITDNGAGDYTVNFTTAMSDTNYAVVAMNGSFGGGNSPIGFYEGSATARTTSLVRLISTQGALGADGDRTSVAIFR